jgi:hypothetical protein
MWEKNVIECSDHHCVRMDGSIFRNLFQQQSLPIWFAQRKWIERVKARCGLCMFRLRSLFWLLRGPSLRRGWGRKPDITYNETWERGAGCSLFCVVGCGATEIIFHLVRFLEGGQNMVDNLILLVDNLNFTLL